jgi:hypothetical protein
MNTPTRKWIELFLLTKLQGVELIHFQQRLAIDSTLRRELYLEKMLIKNIKILGRQRWREKLQSYDQEINGSG